MNPKIVVKECKELLGKFFIQGLVIQRDSDRGQMFRGKSLATEGGQKWRKERAQGLRP